MTTWNMKGPNLTVMNPHRFITCLRLSAMERFSAF